MRVLVLAGFLAAAGCKDAPPDPPVTIFAASSLKEAVTEIATQWTAKTGRPHRLQFEASSTLARQIQEGAPADVFISAAPDWMDRVQPRDRRDWLGNALVCVVARDAASFDWKQVKRLALANEEVPAGKYAKAALAHLDIKPAESPLYGSNVRDVLSKVAHGGADAAIVYATDASIDPAVRVAFTFPAGSHPKIVYAAGVVTDRGRDFFSALSEPWALDIALRHGFQNLR